MQAVHPPIDLARLPRFHHRQRHRIDEELALRPALALHPHLHHGGRMVAGWLIPRGDKAWNRGCCQDFAGGMGLAFGDGGRRPYVLP